MLEYAGEESRVRTCRTVVGSCESKEVNAAEAADTPFSSEWNICRPRKPPQSPPKVVCILPSSLFETGIYIYIWQTPRLPPRRGVWLLQSLDLHRSSPLLNERPDRLPSRVPVQDSRRKGLELEGVPWHSEIEWGSAPAPTDAEAVRIIGSPLEALGALGLEQDS